MAKALQTSLQTFLLQSKIPKMSTLMPLCRLSVLRAIGCNLSAVGSLSSIIGQSDDNEKQQHPMKKLNMGAMVKFASLSDTGPTPIVKDVRLLQHFPMQ